MQRSEGRKGGVTLLSKGGPTRMPPWEPGLSTWGGFLHRSQLPRRNQPCSSTTYSLERESMWLQALKPIPPSPYRHS